MSTSDASRRVAACNNSKTERVVRGVVALVVAAFAVGMIDQWWIAAPAGVFAAFLAVTSVTGWCPADLLPRRRVAPVRQNTLGFPDARELVRVGAAASDTTTGSR